MIAEPRLCADCGEQGLEPHDLICPVCTGDTRAISDVEDDILYRQGADFLAEPGPTMGELYRQARVDRLAALRDVA